MSLRGEQVMTEFEINKKVADKLGFQSEIRENGTWVFDNIWIPFDPCNYVSQAWEIMMKYGITIVFQRGKYQFATFDGEIESNHKKPLVAAMLVFLEI